MKVIVMADLGETLVKGGNNVENKENNNKDNFNDYLIGG